MIVGRAISLHSVAASVRVANLVFVLWALIVTALQRLTPNSYLSLDVAPLTLMGAALTLFLAFRTNSAYDRWWEARTLWGGIVNHSRNLGRQALTYLPPAPDGGLDPLARDLICHQMAWVNAVRTHLRKQDPVEAARPYLSPDDGDALRGEQNVPSALLLRMGRRLGEAFRDGRLDSIRFVSLNDTLTELTNLVGACERIKNTPLPRQYDTVPALAVYAYSVLLPLGLVKSLGWWTPLVCAIITSLLIAIDSIGSNIEDPFENTIHDTPMTTLCRTIEINLQQMLGEKEPPKPLEPKRGILL